MELMVIIMAQTVNRRIRSYTHTDFSDLLEELQEKSRMDAGQSVSVEATEKSSSPAPSAEISLHKQRILSNETFKYVYCISERIIHDKHCPCCRDIADCDFAGIEEYDETMRQCPKCMERAYITLGAKDSKSYRKYQKIFRKFQATTEDLKLLYLTLGAKTTANYDAITVWHKEDAWHIQARREGRVRLYHNNYIVLKDGTRKFTEGFHVQNAYCEETDLRYALNVIKNYAYSQSNALKHKKSATPVKPKDVFTGNTDSLDQLLQNNKKEETFFAKILVRIRKMFFQAQGRDPIVRDGFHRVEKAGYPKDGTICVYIWKNRQGRYLWQVGIYDKNAGQFSVIYGSTKYVVNQERVAAWKRMNDQALELKGYDL